MGEVVNFIFLGTGEHRDSTKSVLTQLADHIHKTAGEVRLFDGPGSKRKHSEHYTPGQYIYDADTDTKQHRHTSDVAKIFYEACQQVSGGLAGDGVEDNMLEALLYLEKIIKNNQGKLPEKINLFGFSRGADTAVRLSNILAITHPEVEVNICAIDDVPGPGRRSDFGAKTIRSNVREMLAIYMMDENRPPFEPQDPDHLNFETPEKTVFKAQFYRGIHSDPTKLKHEKTGYAAGKLGWDDCCQFAERHGVMFEKNDGVSVYPAYVKRNPNPAIKSGSDKYQIEETNSRPLTSEERLELYQKMQMNDEFYKKNRNGGILPLRSFVKKRKEYFRDADYFLSQEHRELFKEKYPVTFDYLFQGNVENYSRMQVMTELQKMFDENHNTFVSLKKYDVAMQEEGIKLPPSRGLKIIEESPIKNNRPLVYDEFSYLTVALRNILNDAARKMSVSDEVTASVMKLKHVLHLVKNSELSPEHKCHKLVLAIAQQCWYLKSLGLNDQYLYKLEGILDAPHIKAFLIDQVLSRMQKEHSDPEVFSILEATKHAVVSIESATNLDGLEKQQLFTETLKAAKSAINTAIPIEEQSNTIQMLQRKIAVLGNQIETQYQYVDKAIKQIKSYVAESKIKGKFQEVFEFFGIKTDLELRQQKISLAEDVIKQLIECKETGNGNNKGEINKILSDALRNAEILRKSFGKSEHHFEEALQKCLYGATSLRNLKNSDVPQDNTNDMPSQSAIVMK